MPYIINFISTEGGEGKSYVIEALKKYWNSIGLKTKVITWKSDFRIDSREYNLAKSITDLYTSEEEDILIVEYPNLREASISLELAKMAVIIAVSFILSKRQDEEGANPKAFKYIMILTGLVLLLIAPENLSTAMLLFGVVFMMMFIGRVAAKKLLLLAGGLVLIVALGVGTVVAIPAKTLHNTPGLHRLETWQNRIKGFFDKDEVPAAKFDIDKDAQIAHARIAIATSHVVGKGPGNSIQRDFLSQAFSDFIFAIVIEEMGLIGGIFVVFLYLCLLMRAGRIAQKCERTFPAFLVMGIALLLVSQAILNMMVAVGLFPVTGQPLPLVSKGGTSTLINCAYIGMILSVSRYTAHLEEQKAHDAQIQMQIEAETATSEAQAAAEPTAQILNSDAKFEDEHDSSK